MADQAQLNNVADQMEAELKKAPKQATPVGHGRGFIAHFQDLINAVRGGDRDAILNAFTDCWVCLFGTNVVGSAAPAGFAAAERQLAGLKLDIGKILALLKMILDLVA